MKRTFLFLFAVALSAPACADDKPFMLESDAVTRATGTVIAISKSSICMDGATYTLHMQQNNIRLKARNPVVEGKLAQAASRGKPVAVTGHNVIGPECSYLNVDSVGPAEGPQRSQGKPHR